MYWANFLHIYQPPTQKEFWVKKIANESYRKIIDGFKKNPRTKATLNINAVLTELFAKYNCQDVIDGLRALAEKGQIEFTASAKYHPFLPMMPRAEIERQIILNTKTNKKYFGPVYNPIGFFPPEMAYSKAVAEVVAKMKFRWLILDELAYSGKIKDIDWRSLYTIKGFDGLNVFFREREASFRILSAEVGMSVFTGNMLVKLLGDRVRQNEYLITAMDGETFGHHRPGLEMLLFDLYTVRELEPITISELLNRFTMTKAVEPRPSSWALMKRDIEQNTPYSRWKDKDNVIQALQWKLTSLAIKTLHQLPKTNRQFPKIRAELDRALHSDQYWWASAMPWWSIEMIEAGAKELRDVVLHSPKASKSDKERANKLYQDILYKSFDWQRSGKVEVLAKQADEDVTQRITKDIPYIPIDEFNAMVENLETQMKQAASSKEYERAAQIRDRVKELNEKKDQITKQ